MSCMVLAMYAPAAQQHIGSEWLALMHWQRMSEAVAAVKSKWWNARQAVGGLGLGRGLRWM